MDVLFDDLPKLNEEEARKYLAFLRWGQWASCPYCGNSKAYFIEDGRRYKCANKNCYKKFSVTVKTLMEATNLSGKEWLNILWYYIKKRGKCSIYDLSNHASISERCMFFIKEKIDFCWGLISQINKDSAKLFLLLITSLFDNYEKFDDFSHTNHTSKYHISDAMINDISNIKQYNKLFDYTRYYVNFYCEWIYCDFASPADILAETFLYMHENHIKEYNGSSIIKLIQQTINRMWYQFMKETPRYANRIRGNIKMIKEDARINLKKYYLVEVIYSSANNKLSRAEIKNRPDLLKKARERLIKHRQKTNSNYGFNSHFV